MLVVDDSHTVRCFLQRTFETKGFQVDVATNGWQALTQMQSHMYDIVDASGDGQISTTEAIKAVQGEKVLSFKPSAPPVAEAGTKFRYVSEVNLQLTVDQTLLSFDQVAFRTNLASGVAGLEPQVWITSR